jgi:hypothetical protein
MLKILNEIRTYLIWERILHESHKKSIPQYQRSLFDYEPSRLYASKVYIREHQALKGTPANLVAQNRITNR